MRKKIQELLEEPEYLQSVLESGAEKARSEATSTWLEIRSKVGFDSSFVEKVKKVSLANS